MLGADKTAALAKRVGSGSLRLPLGKPFIAKLLRDRGYTVNDTARKLHVTDTTVREWLKSAPAPVRKDDRQLKLL